MIECFLSSIDFILCVSEPGTGLDLLLLVPVMHAAVMLKDIARHVDAPGSGQTEQTVHFIGGNIVNLIQMTDVLCLVTHMRLIWHAISYTNLFVRRKQVKTAFNN